MNSHRLSSRYIDYQTKAATYDGPPHLSSESLANDTIGDELVRMVAEVAHHVLRVEHKVVSRFVALFKQDNTGKPWFLYATSIRVASDSANHGGTKLDPAKLVYSLPPPQGLRAPTKKSRPHSKGEVSMDARGQPSRGFIVAPPRTSSPSGSEIHRSLTRRHHAAGSGDPSSLSASDSFVVSHVLQTAVLSKDSPELRAVKTFIDDTFYSLYSQRMAAQPSDAVIVVPPRVAQYLGEQFLRELMCDCLFMQRDTVEGAAPDAPQKPTSLRYTAAKGVEAPLSLMRNQCEAMLDDMAKALNRD